MLPRNLLIVSMVIFLTTTVTTAPVEEKEQEELEVEATEEGEGELSEEEGDDDDSKSQDKIEGIPGVQQTTTAAVAGGSGSKDSEAAASELSGVSTSQTYTAGSDRVDSESNGNAQKLLNGGRGGGGGADSQPGVLGSSEGVSHLDHAGIINPSAHHFLLGLMGGGDLFRPDGHIDIPVISSGVTAAESTLQSGSSSLDSPADSVHQSDISIDQSGQGHTPLKSGPDQLLSSSFSGPFHSAPQEALAASSSSSYGEAHREQTGNGRQTLLIDTNGVTNEQVPLTDLQTDVTAGGAEAVTSHIHLTASGLGLGHDITELPPLVLHTESVDSFTHTMTSDLVTIATSSTGDTVSATGSSLDPSHTAVTDHTQVAGPVTEQYNPSGQGPEGAENVELEDTC